MFCFLVLKRYCSLLAGSPINFPTELHSKKYIFSQLKADHMYHVTNFTHMPNNSIYIIGGVNLHMYVYQRNFP